MQAGAGPGIKPCKTPAEPMHAQLAATQILDVHIGDFQFAARRRFQIPGDGHDLVVINVKTGNGVVALGLPGLFFDRNCLAMGIKLHHAIAFRIIDVVTEDHRAAFEIRESCVKSIRSIEHIITEDQCDGVLANERFGNQKSLGNSLGPGLLSIIDTQAPRAAIPEQLAETGQIVRGGNEAKFPDTAFDQSRQWIIDHRFIKDRLKLFACDQS